MVWVGPLHSMEEMNCGLVSFCVAEHAPPAAGGWSCCPQPLNWSNKRKQNNLSIQFNSSFLTALGRADKKKNELMGLPRSCWLLGEPLVHSIPLAFIYWFINKVDSINKFISFHSISLRSLCFLQFHSFVVGCLGWLVFPLAEPMALLAPITAAGSKDSNPNQQLHEFHWFVAHESKKVCLFSLLGGAPCRLRRA